jgi:DNA-binding MarR family transcriptional regulator
MGEKVQALQAWKGMLAYNAEVIFRIERELKLAGAIPLAYYDILIELELAPDKRLRMYDLAEACLLTKSGITKNVNALEKHGYLTRERCPSDRRGLFAVLNKAGHAAVKKAAPVYKRCIEAFFASALTEGETKTLEKIFGRLRAKLPGSFMEEACKK